MSESFDFQGYLEFLVKRGRYRLTAKNEHEFEGCRVSSIKEWLDKNGAPGVSLDLIRLVRVFQENGVMDWLNFDPAEQTVLVNWMKNSKWSKDEILTVVPEALREEVQKEYDDHDSHNDIMME
jgi:hypothetical protein